MKLRRAALVALVVLLGWQALVGLDAELARLRATTLAERRAALSPATAWRYDASLGSGAEWLAVLRPHLVPEHTLVIVHDGSDDAVRLSVSWMSLLYPLPVHPLPWPADRPAPPPGDEPDDVLVAHLGPRGRFTESLLESGLVPLVDRADLQLFRPPVGTSSVDTLPQGIAPAGPAGARGAAPPPPPDGERLHGTPLLLLAALPLLLGALVLRCLRIGPRSEPLAFWGWAWMAGCLVVGLALLAWMLAGLPLSALTPPVLGGLALLATAAHAALLVRAARRGRAGAGAVPAGNAGPRGAGWERALFACCLGLALALVLDRIVLASSRVVIVGDEAGIWAAKAKALWAADGMGGSFADVANAERGIVHQDYPLLDPLLQVYTFALAGRSLDFENRLPMQLCLPALLLVAAGALRRRVRPSVAALLLLLLATAQQTGVAAGDACADGMVALSLLAALDAGERWCTGGERRWFVLGALALAFLVFSKHEGKMLALAAVAGLLATGAVRDARAAARRAGAREPSPRLLLWLLLPLAVAAVGAAVNARFGFWNDHLAPSDGVSLPARLVAQLPARTLPLLGYVGAFLLRGGVETHLLFAAGFALLLLFPGPLLRRDPAGHRPPCASVPPALLLALAGYLAIYVSFFGKQPQWEQLLRTSLARVLYHLTPALVLWLGAASSWLAAGAARVPDAAVAD